LDNEKGISVKVQSPSKKRNSNDYSRKELSHSSESKRSEISITENEDMEESSESPDIDHASKKSSLKSNNQKPKSPDTKRNPRDLSPIRQKQIPVSTIPAKYHQKEKSPILPAVSSKGDEILEYKDNIWYKTWFPSNRPKDRREVLQLAQTFETMMQEIAAEGDSSVSQIDREQRVYDIVLNELIRQVYVECSDRGILLEKVSTRYKELFSRVPELLLAMKNERDNLNEANKSLSILLEKLMEEKTGIETLLRLKEEQLDSLERKQESSIKQTEEDTLKMKYLQDERELALQEARRYQENFRIQENINKQLHLKDMESQASVISLTKQLEEALTRLHEYEGTAKTKQYG